MKKIFTGSGVAIITPMQNDGSVNYETFGRLIEFQIENGTDFMVVCGTTGESATLTASEHSSVIKYAVEKVNGRIPVVAGAGSNDTKHATELSKQAQSLGADGLLVVTPYYNKTSQTGLLKHYTAIADTTDLPIILYNVPSRTGCSIASETYAKLAAHPNIIGCKEANGDISSVAKTLSLCPEDFAVYSGNDDQTVPIMALGGVGVISVFSNVCPDISHKITSCCLAGDFETARTLQLKYLRLMNALFCDVNPIPVKAAMNLLGFDCGICRMPLDQLSGEGFNALKSTLQEFALIK